MQAMVEAMGRLRRFWADRAGNITILFTLMAVPVLGGIGLAVDFGQALTLRHKLAIAADIAALGSIAEKSLGATAAAKMTADGDIPVAVADARQLMTSNIPGSLAENGVAFDVQVTKTGYDLKSTVSYSAKMPTSLARLFGKSSIDISGSATAQHRIAQFMDFYILIDNTPSMGVGATSSDIATMEANTSDKCAFACHQLDKTKDNYALAKKLGVQMRIDVVREAAQKLTETATSVQTAALQFRMGVYTFGASAETAKLTTITDPISDMAKVKAYSDAVDLMTIPYQNYNSDQLTNFDGALKQMNTLIDQPGDGSSGTNREKILFFVSDGVGDSYKPVGCTKKLNNSRCQEPIDVSFCTPLKTRGVKIAVLYTTYLPLPKNDWYNTWIKPFQSDIATKMQNCASPGLYYEVGPGQGIAEAMNALFIKAVRTVRLSS